MQSFLAYAAQRYYEGSPILSDEEFDALAEKCGYESVGYSAESGVPHAFRMYSLQKFYAGEKEFPFTGVWSPKFDGAAISLIYINRELKVALTRGDGVRGQNISHLIPGLPVPRKLAEGFTDLTQITGEIVAPISIPNARNYASGALGLKDVEEFATRTLSFLAYGVQPYVSKTWTEDMDLLHKSGFHTVISFDKPDDFPKDGLVVRVNDYKDFESKGYTSTFPKGAYAIKERKEGVVTKLLSVDWQVGKSGVVSPVAILEPVNIDGATVARATLHNIRYIRELELEIGCSVEVVRSGDIIPRIIRKV